MPVKYRVITVPCATQSSEIADAFSNNNKPVEFHRASIRKKPGVTNLSELFRVIFGNSK
jgi:DNA-binding CsgD family transcriptional regulator